MLRAEWPLLLECASPRPEERRFRELLSGAVNWNAFLTLAEEHGVIGVVSRRLKESGGQHLPREMARRLEDRYRAQVFFTLSLTAELVRLLDRLGAAGIEALVVKGPVLSVAAYGDPGLRQYADVDLLVRDRDILRSTELLLHEGFAADVPLEAIRAGKIPGEYLFTRPRTRLLVELHTERTFRYFPRPLPLESFFERRIGVPVDAHVVPALCVEDELILGCIHGAKHFWERLMWIADLAAVVARQSTLRWDLVEERAVETGARRMLYAGLLLAADLLHAALPGEIARQAARDPAAARLVRRIRGWLPWAGYAPPGIIERAFFRMRMRGGMIAGPLYLAKLSLSPTEEDWVEGAEGKRPWLLDAIRRPFRLAKKYGRDGHG